MLEVENFRKMLKVFIAALLCSELHSNLAVQNINPGTYAYAAELNDTHATWENSKYHASVRLAALDENFGEGHICSGALIAPSVILTVAHCLYDYERNSQRHPSELRVVMGTQKRYQRMQSTLDYGVTHLYTPPTFDSQTLRDNIAILMLERDIFGNSYIQPASFNFNNEGDRLDPKSQLRVTTWATTIEGSPLSPLLQLNATLSTDSSCQRSFGKIHDLGMVCINLLNINENVCPLDSGAPLMIDNELIGLSVVGNDCGFRSLPAIYIDVRQQREWIKDMIGDGNNQNSSIWGTLGLLAFTAFAARAANYKRRKTLPYNWS